MPNKLIEAPAVQLYSPSPLSTYIEQKAQGIWPGRTLSVEAEITRHVGESIRNGKPLSPQMLALIRSPTR